MGYYLRFRGAIPQIGVDTCVLLSRPPLTHSLAGISSLDLHISGTPPTFILSQDQTLKKKLLRLFHHIPIVNVLKTNFYIIRADYV